MDLKKVKKIAIESFSNINSMQAISNTIHGAAGYGIPIHEKYPPSFVLKPQKTFPYLKPMRGSDYYNELKKKRGW